MDRYLTSPTGPLEPRFVQPAWFADGLDPAVAYDLAAASYDSWKWQRLWGALEWPLIRGLLRQAGVGQSGSSAVLDIGTGTATYLRNIMNEFGVRDSWGCDVSEGMLDVARNKVGDRARFISSDAGNLDFDDGRFDVVLLCRVSSHLPDVLRAATEAGRVLRSGGVLIVSDVDPRHPYDQTRLPVMDKKIAVKTYKHSAGEWRQAMAVGRLGFRRQRTITSRCVWRSGLDDIPTSIETSRNHVISYILSAQKVD